MLGSLGPYRILSPLGAGGMGEVYLATDTRLNRNVAIKVLPAITASDDEAQRRMLREARMVATIDHPNVCTIYDIGEDAERPYIVMQYIEGETLSERMRRGRLDLADTVGIARQVTLALAEAHSRGIVHRDIKPGNIMISSAGVVKVLDFGLAKSTARDTSVTELMVSREGMVVGTTAYMSPEQLRAEALDGRSDIFSLGVVLYEIASGARPFDRPTVAATITAILTEDPPPLDTPLQPVIARALAKPLSRRYASAAALHEALTELGEGRRPTASRKPKASAIESIAVLPLVSESVDSSFDYVAEGLLDRIVARLSHVPHLKVVRYRGRIPDQLGVQAVISGRVSVAPTSLTLQLDMKDARNGSPLWQGTFERSGRPIEELAVEVAGQIAGSGKPRTKKKERAVDPAAEKLYLRGRFQWNKRHPDAIRQAISCFQEAIERDPMYANAYAGLADAYLMLGFLQVAPAARRDPESEGVGPAGDRARPDAGRAARLLRIPGRHVRLGLGDRQARAVRGDADQSQLPVGAALVRHPGRADLARRGDDVRHPRARSRSALADHQYRRRRPASPAPQVPRGGADLLTGPGDRGVVRTRAPLSRLVVRAARRL